MAAGRDAEKKVRVELELEFQMEFSEERLALGQTLNGGDAGKKFDSVSDNGDIVAMVKDYSAENKNGNRTRLARVAHDLLLLHLAPAKTKFMYLSESFYDWFEGTYDAVVPNDVTVRTIPR